MCSSPIRIINLAKKKKKTKPKKKQREEKSTEEWSGGVDLNREK